MCVLYGIGCARSVVLLCCVWIAVVVICNIWVMSGVSCLMMYVVLDECLLVYLVSLFVVMLVVVV